MPASSWAQRVAGELRVRVTDEEGLSAQADGTLEGAATGVRRSFTTDERGTYVADNLPFGIYHLQVTRPGFAPFSTMAENCSRSRASRGSNPGASGMARVSRRRGSPWARYYLKSII